MGLILLRKRCDLISSPGKCSTRVEPIKVPCISVTLHYRHITVAADLSTARKSVLSVGVTFINYVIALVRCVVVFLSLWITVGG